MRFRVRRIFTWNNRHIIRFLTGLMMIWIQVISKEVKEAAAVRKERGADR